MWLVANLAQAAENVLRNNDEEGKKQLVDWGWNELNNYTGTDPRTLEGIKKRTYKAATALYRMEKTNAIDAALSRASNAVNNYQKIKECECPACSQYGLAGLKAPRSKGFHCRAIHNLYVLLEEQKLIEYHLRKGTYITWYQSHLSNSTYKPLVDKIIQSAEQN